MYVVLLTSDPQPKLLQLPTADGKFATVQYDTIDDIIQDLKGRFIESGPTLPGKGLSVKELDFNIWAVKLDTGEGVFLNELLR